jgi:hypothetical protein
MKRVFVAVLGVALALPVAFVGDVLIRNRPLPQNAHDVPILERTVVLLESEALWSQHDNRRCDSSATQLSLYCALRQASIDISGQFHHRAAALQAVRRAIDAERPHNNYEHRLQDFNNASDVSLDTIHKVLHRAIEELRRAAVSQEI